MPELDFLPDEGKPVIAQEGPRVGVKNKKRSCDFNEGDIAAQQPKKRARKTALEQSIIAPSMRTARNRNSDGVSTPKSKVSLGVSQDVEEDRQLAI